MEKQNKFKIIIPSYNNEQWVEYNIASILNQTYTNYKVLYINDASTDKTLDILTPLIKYDNRFIIRNNKVNKGAAYNYIEYVDDFIEDEDDIIIHLDGDDWFFDENVLKNLNNYYNTNDFWMTYGGFVCYNGSEEVTLPYPQSTSYSDFVHDHKLYRRDSWRASHLRTFRAFLFKTIDKEDLKSKYTQEYFWHASDLSWQFPCLEMCGKEKIGIVDFYTHVYNQTPSNQVRTQEREHIDNSKYEVEIRNKKIYKQGLTGEKLPQINVIGYFQETNYIPKDFSFVYGLEEGEFDATLITDADLLPYLKKEKLLPKGKIIADLHESPIYSPIQSEVYDLVYKNYNMFDLILTHNKKLLSLPNSQLRLCLSRCLNKNIHTKEWPLLADHSLYKIYEKNKNLSCISSNKSFLEGHRKRLEFVNHVLKNTPKGELDMFGIGFNPIQGKIEGLKDYRFSIAIENSYAPNEASEKISDCFLTGTIPIYYGCPNIGDYFDINGIITFETKEELENIIQDIILNGEQIYKSKFESVKNNFKLIDKYSLNIDQIFTQYIKPIL